MNVLRLALSAVLSTTICTAAVAQDAKVSTPEERAHWVEVLHKLESQPDDKQTSADAGKVIVRMIEVSDFSLAICDAIGELPKNYSYKQPITQLFMLGLAGYQLETGKKDGGGSNLYAFHSVLKGYAILLQKDASARDKKLDELARMDAEGKLPGLIKKLKGCK